MDIAEPIELRIRSQEGEIILFDIRFRQLSKLISEVDIYNEIPTSISSSVLKEIKKFCELHDYSLSTMKIKSPLVSSVLSEHIDELSYQVMEKYFGADEEHYIMIDPLLQALYYLDFEMMKEMCLITIGVPYYVGPSEADQEKFKKKWGLEEQTPDQERQTMIDNYPVFEDINRVYQIKMELEEQKYMNSQKDAPV